MPRRKTLTERPNLRLRLLTEPFSYPPEGSGPIVRASATPSWGLQARRRCVLFRNQLVAIGAKLSKNSGAHVGITGPHLTTSGPRNGFDHRRSRDDGQFCRIVGRLFMLLLGGHAPRHC